MQEKREHLATCRETCLYPRLWLPWIHVCRKTIFWEDVPSRLSPVWFLIVYYVKHYLSILSICLLSLLIPCKETFFNDYHVVIENKPFLQKPMCSCFGRSIHHTSFIAMSVQPCHHSLPSSATKYEYAIIEYFSIFMLLSFSSAADKHHGSEVSTLQIHYSICFYCLASMKLSVTCKVLEYNSDWDFWNKQRDYRLIPKTEQKQYC